MTRLTQVTVRKINHYANIKVHFEIPRQYLAFPNHLQQNNELQMDRWSKRNTEIIPHQLSTILNYSQTRSTTISSQHN